MASGLFTKRDFQVSLEMAWHKLTRLEKPTIEHFPNIVAMPLHYNGGKDAKFGDNQYMIPVAEDDMLPVAPPYCEGSYSLFTPKEAWNWVAEILAGTGYNVQSIGMLWNRSKWFISTELQELKAVKLGGRDSKFQFNFSGGLDRKMSPQAEVSNIIQVCSNTVSLSRKSGQVLFNEKATKNFKTRLELAKAEVEKAVGMAAIFKAEMDKLAENPCNTNRAERIFAGFITPIEDEKMSTRAKNTVQTLADLHVSGLGNRGETEFDMLNAYTQLLTRGTEDSKLSEGRRFVSSEFGNNADSKAEFARLLTTGRDGLQGIEKRGESLLTVAVN